MILQASAAIFLRSRGIFGLALALAAVAARRQAQEKKPQTLEHDISVRAITLAVTVQEKKGVHSPV
jgi:hypothetical protein